MQPVAWYCKRLQSMSAREISWRVQSTLKDLMAYWRFRNGRSPHGAASINRKTADGFNPAFRLSPVKSVDWQTKDEKTSEARWIKELIRKADDICDHRLSYFDLVRQHHGDPVNWNYDHGNRRPTEKKFAPFVDYRDLNLNGDCKLVWEPNRHHQFVVLARAYCATGDGKYLLGVLEQLASWMEQNPAGTGMNWRSPMELAIRLINWAWAWDLIHDAGKLNGELGYLIQKFIHQQLVYITHRYSKGTSANNHLIGEAAGVYVASCYFHTLPNVQQWKKESKQILIEELYRQTYDDGCGREHAFGYQFFILQFFIFAGITGRRCGDDFPQEYWRRIETMIDFLFRLGQGGRIPLLGDSDDGYVLDLGNGPDDIQSLLCIGAVLFQRGDFKKASRGYSQAAWWLFGEKGREQFDRLEINRTDETLESYAFEPSGYYLLQCGNGCAQSPRISLLMDCAPLGYGAIAAHGHADALSVILRINGEDILVDPGTYDYFSYPRWRQYFRSTRAHNTVEIDGLDQSEMLGPFIWGRKADAGRTLWEPSADGGRITGEHGGYLHLEDPLMHRRGVVLDGKSKKIEIYDQLAASGKHTVIFHFHFGPACTLEQTKHNTWEIRYPGGRLEMTLAPCLSVEPFKGSVDPIAGWQSCGYHRKEPATTLRCQCETIGNASFTHTMALL